MANQEHLDILKQGVEAWNQWRRKHRDIRPDLSFADLSFADLSEAHFYKANLSEARFYKANLSFADLSFADLSGAKLGKADLSGANLSGATFPSASLNEANLSGANLSGAFLPSPSFYKADLREAKLGRADLGDADLRGANLSGADFSFADLSFADLSGADLSRATLVETDLSRATLVETNLKEATLIGCSIYGISVWNVQLEGTKQDGLVITRHDEPSITVDNLKVAQFIYLLLNNAEIREVIDTVARKAVLILGRFTPERKAVLDALKEALRTYGYVPILFDFDKPASRDLTETVSTLAHLARFIVVDLADPSSAPHEVATVIPYTVVPVQPLLSQEPLMVDGRVVERHEYAMFRDLKRRYDWVLPTHCYTDQDNLLATLKEQVIEPAEQKAQELEKQ